MDTPPEIGITIAEIAKAVLVGIGSVTLWLLKKLGDKHMASLDDVVQKQDLILKNISGIDTRVAVLESQMRDQLHQKHSHHDGV